MGMKGVSCIMKEEEGIPSHISLKRNLQWLVWYYLYQKCSKLYFYILWWVMIPVCLFTHIHISKKKKRKCVLLSVYVMTMMIVGNGDLSNVESRALFCLLSDVDILNIMKIIISKRKSRNMKRRKRYIYIFCFPLYNLYIIRKYIFSKKKSNGNENESEKVISL